MSGKVFINYRREDSQDAAARIHRELSLALGPKSFFMDVDNLRAGQRFDKVLAQALDECDVLVAVIGPQWMSTLRERQRSKERDYVREEITAALKREIPVVPVLVNQAHLPREEELPEDIRDLVKYQKHDVRHEHFGRDIEPLLRDIEFLRRADPEAGSWRKLAGALAVFGAITAAAVMYVNIASAPPPSTGAGDASVSPEQETAKAVAEAAEVKRRADELEQAEAERQRLAMLAAQEQGKRKKAEEEARKAKEERKAREQKQAASQDESFATPEPRSAANLALTLPAPPPVPKLQQGRGWLGVKIQNLDADTAAAIGLPEVKGALIASVVPGGPAEAVGLTTGDAITAINGASISDSRELADTIARQVPGTPVTLSVWRQGAEQGFDVTVGSTPERGDGSFAPGDETGHDGPVPDDAQADDAAPAASPEIEETEVPPAVPPPR